MQRLLVNLLRKYQPRQHFTKLRCYLRNNYMDHICIVYGTGFILTTGYSMKHLCSEFAPENVPRDAFARLAYICLFSYCATTTSMAMAITWPISILCLFTISKLKFLLI